MIPPGPKVWAACKPHPFNWFNKGILRCSGRCLINKFDTMANSARSARRNVAHTQPLSKGVPVSLISRWTLKSTRIALVLPLRILPSGPYQSLVQYSCMTSDRHSALIDGENTVNHGLIYCVSSCQRYVQQLIWSQNLSAVMLLINQISSFAITNNRNIHLFAGKIKSQTDSIGINNPAIVTVIFTNST